MFWHRTESENKSCPSPIAMLLLWVHGDGAPTMMGVAWTQEHKKYGIDRGALLEITCRSATTKFSTQFAWISFTLLEGNNHKIP